jgi:hypothetical protein
MMREFFESKILSIVVWLVNCGDGVGDELEMDKLKEEKFG